jgi:hypothetical protein
MVGGLAEVTCARRCKLNLAVFVLCNLEKREKGPTGCIYRRERVRGTALGIQLRTSGHGLQNAAFNVLANLGNPVLMFALWNVDCAKLSHTLIQSVISQ